MIVQSAIAKVRKILRDNGYALGRVTGRYHPIGGAGTQKIEPGWNVRRIGCSSTITLLYRDSNPHIGPREKREEFAHILSILRGRGMNFDDRGWMECGGQSGL